MINKQNGYTVVELLVAMAMSLAILGAARTMYVLQAHTVKAQENQMEAEEYARVTLDMMAREIRNLGYFPKITACATGSGNGGLVEANATKIRIVYDYRGDAANSAPDGNCDDPDEDVTYERITNADGTCDITRTANGTTQPLTNSNVSCTSVFSYWKTRPALVGYTDTNLLNASVRNQVQRIDISLTVNLKRTDARVGGQHSVAMNSSVNLRNH